MITTNRHSTSFNDLATLFTGQLVLPEDANYEQVRQLFNGRVKIQPAAIARCLTVQDVIHTIRWTRSHHLPLSVRGAGHEIFGRSLIENGVVIDLSQMRAVTIRPVRKLKGDKKRW
jgi:FAD/FMN-containing dehydrogenase